MKSKHDLPRLEIRDALFGDIPLEGFLHVSPETLLKEPWARFVQAKQMLEAGEREGAVEIFRRVSEMSQLEPRMYLQAWHFLRQIGVNPPEERSKELLGVVIEVGMPKGLDLVAGYADHCARYYNFSGAGVVWERPNNLLDAAIDDLLRSGSAVLQSIGPWKSDRPAAPHAGQARINLLTPSGLHFGQGPMQVLSKDQLGGPVLASAFRLMQALIQPAKK